MGITSANPESEYLAFFDSIMDECTFSASFGDLQWTFSSEPDPPFVTFPSLEDSELSSDPNERLPSPPITAPPAPADVEVEIHTYWLTLIEKSRKLKDRLEQEKARVEVLKEEFEAGHSSDKALHDVIMTRVAWLQSISRNQSLTVRDHKMAQGLHGNRILAAIVERIEQRQRAVEVALQQGPGGYADNSGQDVMAEIKEKDKEERTTEALPEDRLFRMEDANSGMRELDLPFSTLRKPADTRQNAPPIGMFALPKPAKKQK